MKGSYRPLITIFLLLREYQEMVGLGLLGLPVDVCSKLDSTERVSWTQMEQGKGIRHTKSRPTASLFRTSTLMSMIFYMQATNHSFSNDTLGIQILKARGIFVDPNWYWIGVGGLIAYILLFNILFIVFLHFLGRKS